MTIKAVAWDIDGTLVDSEPLHLRALLATCTEYGVDISDLSDDRFVGVNLHGVWEVLKERFPGNLSRERWISVLNAHYCRGARGVRPIPHAAETVRALAAMGLSQVAISNSNRVIVDANLKALGVAELMRFSLSLDDVPVGKPDPLPYHMAMERLGLRPAEMLAVEDSPSGIASACAAGVPVAGLAASPVDVAAADKTITTLGEVVTIVTAANGAKPAQK